MELRCGSNPSEPVLFSLQPQQANHAHLLPTVLQMSVRAATARDVLVGGSLGSPSWLSSLSGDVLTGDESAVGGLSSIWLS